MLKVFSHSATERGRHYASLSFVIISRNDLNDIMEKMKRLEKKEELKNMEVFEFIGYVSRIYTEAMNRNLNRDPDQ